MLVAIDLNVFNSSNSFRALDKILILLEEEKHEWYLEEDVTQIKGSAWVNNLSISHQSILGQIAEKALVRTNNIPVNERKTRGIFRISDNPHIGILPYDSLKVLEDPLLIIVENVTSDKLFIKRLFEIFPQPGKLLLKSLNQNYLDFYPSGGKNGVIKTIESIKNKKPQPYKPRLMVIVDSDKKYPDQEYEKTIIDLNTFCEANNIPIHIFYKRELENYIPEIVLKKKSPPIKRETIEAFCKLNDHQEDFYDLEKGFQGRNIPQDDPLFSNISDKRNVLFMNLKDGFHINRHFIAKQELYKYVEDEDFNERTLNQRCEHQPDPNELLNLLKLISSKL